MLDPDAHTSVPDRFDGRDQIDVELPDEVPPHDIADGCDGDLADYEIRPVESTVDGEW